MTPYPAPASAAGTNGRPEGPWRIALADDHAIVRMGYRRLLELEPDLRVVAEFADSDRALMALTDPNEDGLDLLILDLSMPGRSGLDLLRTLQQQRPALKVLVVSMHDSAAMVAQCLRAGAWGFVPKSGDPEALSTAVRQVLAGVTAVPYGLNEALRAAGRPLPHEQLTAREREVLQALLSGIGVEGVAHRLGLSEKTVANYQTLIRQKLGVSNGIELARYAREHGLG